MFDRTQWYCSKKWVCYLSWEVPYIWIDNEKKGVDTIPSCRVWKWWTSSKTKNSLARLLQKACLSCRLHQSVGRIQWPMSTVQGRHDQITREIKRGGPSFLKFLEFLFARNRHFFKQFCNIKPIIKRLNSNSNKILKLMIN